MKSKELIIEQKEKNRLILNKSSILLEVSCNFPSILKKWFQLFIYCVQHLQLTWYLAVFFLHCAPLSHSSYKQNCPPTRRLPKNISKGAKILLWGCSPHFITAIIWNFGKMKFIRGGKRKPLLFNFCKNKSITWFG